MDENSPDEPQIVVAQIPNLNQRMLAITNDAKRQKPDKKVAAARINYDYISHNAVTELIQPLLVKHGVDACPALQNVVRDQYDVAAYKADDPPTIKNRLTVYFDIKFVNVDDPKDFEMIPWIAEAVGNDDKQLGIAVSAGIRQCYQKRFKLRSGDPDIEEGNVGNDNKEKGGTGTKEKYEPRKEETSGKPRLVSVKQVTFFNQLVEKHGWSEIDVDMEIHSKFGVDNAAQFAMSDFQEVVKILEAGPKADIPF